MKSVQAIQELIQLASGKRTAPGPSDRDLVRGVKGLLLHLGTIRETLKYDLGNLKSSVSRYDGKLDADTDHKIAQANLNPVDVKEGINYHKEELSKLERIQSQHGQRLPPELNKSIDKAGVAHREMERQAKPIIEKAQSLVAESKQVDSDSNYTDEKATTEASRAAQDKGGGGGGDDYNRDDHGRFAPK